MMPFVTAPWVDYLFPINRVNIAVYVLTTVMF